jgi:hypothetical protein
MIEKNTLKLDKYFIKENLESELVGSLYIQAKNQLHIHSEKDFIIPYFHMIIMSELGMIYSPAGWEY